MAEPKISGGWRDWALVDIFRSNRTGLFPWVTLVLCVMITLGNWEILQHGEPGVVWALFANRFSLVHEGEVWRFLTSWLPHMNMLHLWPDVVYLAVVGALIERVLGRVFLLTVFLVGNVFGGVCAFFLDDRYDVLSGSSDGTHALLIALCGILLLSRYRVDRLVAYGAVVWLGYHTVAGLMTGAMGWPFCAIANGGFDHLAALLVGAAAAVQAAQKERALMKASSA